MRTIMFVLVAALAFVVWDALANNGKYVNATANVVAKDLSSTRLVLGSF